MGYTCILGGLNVLTTSVSATYNVVDYVVVLADASSGAFAVNLPAVASSSGKVVWVKKTDTSSNEVTVDGSGSELIDNTATQTLNIPYSALTLLCDGTSWWII